MILACRNLKQAYEVRDEIITETYNRNIEVKHLDLASLESIAKFARDISTSKFTQYHLSPPPHFSPPLHLYTLPHLSPP